MNQHRKTYMKEYYQKNKHKLKPKEPVLCECGLWVKYMWHHEKSKVHNSLIDGSIPESNRFPHQVSFPNDQSEQLNYTLE